MTRRLQLLTAFLCLLSGVALAQPTPAPPQPAPPKPDKKAPLKPLKRTQNAREIRSLVRNLGDPKWEVREAARDRLYELGQECVGPLERAAQDGDAERAAAANELLRALRWKVSAELRQIVGEGLDDFPALAKQERLVGLGAFRRRPQEARAVGVPFLLNVARFDPEGEVRQGAVYVYLEISEPSQPEFDPRFLVALADEKETDGRLNLMRSQLLSRLGRSDEAITAAEIAVQKSPRRRESTLWLIELLLEADRFKEALPIVEAAERVAGNDLEIRILAGEVLVRAGETEKGLAKLATVAKDPAVATNLKVLLRLGRSYLRCDRADDALKVYAEARKKFPLQYELNIASAEVLYAKGKIDSALQVYLSEIRYTAVSSGRYLELTTRIAKILEEGGAKWLAEEEAFFRDAQRGRRVVDALRVVATWLLRRGLAV
ncbi:MAG: CDC27 family protein, partial [Planctomycetes bacterium]|nr:CDC27 family protein [Planctomycetota bacterium]